MLGIRGASPIPKEEELIAPEEGLGDQLDHRDEGLQILLEKRFFYLNALLEGFDDLFFHVVTKSEGILAGRKGVCQARGRATTGAKKSEGKDQVTPKVAWIAVPVDRRLLPSAASKTSVSE